VKPIRNFKKGPEDVIQEAIVEYLRIREWWVHETHGNTYSHGLPDLIAGHYKYGVRFIEVKNPKKYAFTGAQLETFPKMIGHGIPVYVLVAASDSEYRKLFGPSNYWQYLNLI